MAIKKVINSADIIVVGGGPAGMMAAGHAAESGARVMVIEKTYQMGTKLLLTGGGRCNLTNNADLKEFIKAFGKNGKFLYRAFSVFSNNDLIDFFKSRGLEMRVDPDGKVFPSDDSAQSVLNVLRKYIEENKVRVMHNASVSEIILQKEKNPKVEGVRIADGAVINTERVITATGGMSYPQTGSSGEGYRLAGQCGHSIVPFKPGLVPLESDESFIPELQGLTLKDIAITILADKKKVAEETGDILFTHFGVSGPKILILSGIVVDAIDSGGNVVLSLNIRQEHSAGDFDSYLQKEFSSYGNKTFLRYLKDTLPKSFAPVFERLSGVDPDKYCSSISREDRKRIAGLFTDFKIHITKPRPIEEAIITRGGISIEEINPQTMESRIVEGLYFCGEVIDVAGITGGYNLQEAFSTGYLAGESATQNK